MNFIRQHYFKHISCRDLRACTQPKSQFFFLQIRVGSASALCRLCKNQVCFRGPWLILWKLTTVLSLLLF